MRPRRAVLPSCPSLRHLSTEYIAACGSAVHRPGNNREKQSFMHNVATGSTDATAGLVKSTAACGGLAFAVLMYYGRVPPGHAVAYGKVGGGIIPLLGGSTGIAFSRFESD